MNGKLGKERLRNSTLTQAVLHRRFIPRGRHNLQQHHQQDISQELARHAPNMAVGSHHDDTSGLRRVWSGRSRGQKRNAAFRKLFCAVVGRRQGVMACDV